MLKEMHRWDALSASWKSLGGLVHYIMSPSSIYEYEVWLVTSCRPFTFVCLNLKISYRGKKTKLHYFLWVCREPYASEETHSLHCTWSRSPSQPYNKQFVPATWPNPRMYYWNSKQQCWQQYYGARYISSYNTWRCCIASVRVSTADKYLLLIPRCIIRRVVKIFVEWWLYLVYTFMFFMLSRLGALRFSLCLRLIPTVRIQFKPCGGIFQGWV